MRFDRGWFLRGGWLWLGLSLAVVDGAVLAIPAEGRGPIHPSPVEGEAIFSPQEAMSATPCVDGFAGPYPCRNVDLLSFVTLSTMGCTAGNAVWGWTDPVTSEEYALMGCNNGLSIVDITTPESPVYMGRLPTHTVNSVWRDMKVYNNHVFVVADSASNHGMQVWDLTQLRNLAPPRLFAETAYYGGFGSAHNIAINEETGFAYAVGSNTCLGGLHMVDIRNPSSPVFAGCVSEDHYTHDTQCVVYHGPDASHAGQEICFSSNEDTLTIIDVSVKSAPVQLSRTTYAGAEYTHQGWITEDHRYFLIDDELDEQRNVHNTRTYIWDIGDLDAPVNTGFYTGPAFAIDHNLYIRGNYAYQANYRSGLRILDIADIASADLYEVGYFDIYPSADGVSFNGAWGNYPFFPSGTVVVSGIEQGLYVLRPTCLCTFVVVPERTGLEICGAGSDSVRIDLVERGGFVASASLSQTGLFAQAGASFSINPSPVPGSSTMMVTTSQVPQGVYPFKVRATQGETVREADMTLTIANEAPGIPDLLSPSTGAINQPPHVPFQWSTVPQLSMYDLEVSRDAGFTTLEFSATVSGASVTSTDLEAGTTYYWRVRARNACGTGTYSPVRFFVTQPRGVILLVDDDNDSPDVLSYYTAALEGRGILYDVWKTAAAGHEAAALHPEPHLEPDVEALSPYDAVFWFSGDAFGTVDEPLAGPSSTSESALASFLDEGKCLFLSSEDYYFDRARIVTPFMRDYLGVSNVTDNVVQSTVGGTGAVFGGLGSFPLSYPASLTNHSDRVVANSTGATAFYGNSGNAAVTKSAGFRTVYFGFPFEALPTAAARSSVMSRILGFCSGPGEPKGLAVTKTGADLILSWAPPNAPCAASSYAIYRGSLATLAGGAYSHDTVLACGIAGTSYQTPLSNPAIGLADYFLVVAATATDEGTYGTSSANIQRPPSGSACRASQNLIGCSGGP